MATSRICSIPDCGKPAPSNRKGWCISHYVRWRAHGDPLSGKTARGDAQRYYDDVVLTYEGDECLTWPFATLVGGYAKMKDCNVHRRLCEEVNGPPPTPEHQAAHSCGKGHLACVTKRHLTWKTPKENDTDKIAHGTRRPKKERVKRPKRSMRGDLNPNAKLTAEKAREIRNLKGTATQKQIAEQFGVSKQTVSLLLKGGIW